jgi:hypothetical protein
MACNGTALAFSLFRFLGYILSVQDELIIFDPYTVQGVLLRTNPLIFLTLLNNKN